ncbi:MAG: ABC transporter permease [Vicinamibacterales bacterium]
MTRVLLAIVGQLARLLPSPHDRLRDEWVATIARLADDAGGGLAAARLAGREIGAPAREVRRLRADTALARGGAGAWAAGLRLAAVGAIRHWRARPVVTVATLATLALAVAMAVVTYGVARAVLWRPLPFPDAGRLVFVWERESGETAPFRVTAARFAEWRLRPDVFAELALFGAAGAALDTPEGRQPIQGVRVSTTFFSALGVAPVLGRTFVAEDGQPGRGRVVVLSHAAWRQRFGGRSDIVGRDIRLSGQPFTVVGVLPDVVLPGWPANPAVVSLRAEQREYFVPIEDTPQLASNARSHVFGVVARLQPGMTLAGAGTVLAGSRGADPHGATVTMLREQFVADARTPLVVLLAAALGVLLVASLNLAALRVAQHELRRSDRLVRAALGASRRRLVGDEVVEALLVTLLGGGLGLAGAAAALPHLPGLLPSTVPLMTAPRLDAAVLVAALAVLLAVALALAAWPAARMLRPLPSGARPATRHRVYRGLVAAQVAASVALVVPAARLDATLRAIGDVDAGFSVDDVVAVDVGLQGAEASDPVRVAALDTALHQALNGRRGIAGAALAYDHPLEANWIDRVTVDGDTRSPDLDDGVELRIVSPAYFQALDVAVVDGRAFADEDDLARPGVALVNAAFAATLDGRVLGRTLHSQAARFSWGAALPDTFTVIGVVENERFRGLDHPSAPALYLSTRQFPQAAATLLVRLEPEAPPALGDVRLVVRDAAPAATIGALRRLTDIRDEQLAVRTVTASLVGAFAVLVVALAAIGLCGLMSVVVASRARLGVRLAVGAPRSRVAAAVAGEGLACAGAGLLVGVLAAQATSAAVQEMVVGAPGTDPWLFVVVSAALLVVSSAAVAAPAVRAMRVDPVRVLRGTDAGLTAARSRE